MSDGLPIFRRKSSEVYDRMLRGEATVEEYTAALRAEAAVNLAEYRDAGLTPRQREVAQRVRSGEAECGLCGDLGAFDEQSREGVPCMACGKVGVNA
jgi:hypothetical protein